MNIVLSGFSGSIGKTIFNSFVSTEYNFFPYNMRNDRLEFEHDLENFDVFIHLASLNANLQNDLNLLRYIYEEILEYINHHHQQDL